jgi:FkbH-like protein
VVDCDNTLWGGIIGEDGLTGVELSCDFPGRAFVEFQRQLKALRDTGIFLAVCSKNNPEDVDAMFSDHTGMILSRADISCFKVNWRPKSDNIAEIASDLNIGADSIVFLDDSGFEIDEVKAHLPTVECIHLPEELEDIPKVLGKYSYLFDRVYITDDDRQRVDMLRIEQQRRDVAQKLTTQDFLSSLDLKVSISGPAAGDIGRVTQLINKTNQFNVTTQRYSIAEVGSMVSDPDTDIFCASVSDRFGKYGLVGVGIVRHRGGRAELDTLLMSCRVLGRGVESSLLAHAILLTQKRGQTKINATFIPTQKNGMVSDLFESHGFSLLGEQSAGTRLYHRDTSPLELPGHLTVTIGEAGDRAGPDNDAR